MLVNNELKVKPLIQYIYPEIDRLAGYLSPEKV